MKKISGWHHFTYPNEWLDLGDHQWLLTLKMKDGQTDEPPDGAAVTTQEARLQKGHRHGHAEPNQVPTWQGRDAISQSQTVGY